jgi:hypothetical protein
MDDKQIVENIKNLNEQTGGHMSELIRLNQVIDRLINRVEKLEQLTSANDFDYTKVLFNEKTGRVIKYKK